MQLTSSRLQLLELLRREAVLEGDFVLASGKKSKYYIDARRVTLSAEGSMLIGEVVLDAMGAKLPQVVAGMSLGADPLVTAVSVTSAQQGTPVDGLLVRKSQKEHGTGRLIEGPLESGLTAVVLEDTSTTGASALQAVESLRASHVSVIGVITLIDREEGALAAFVKAGVPFQSIYRSSELIDGRAGESPVHPKPESERAGRILTIQTDGASQGNPGRAGAGYVIYDETGAEVDRGSRSIGRGTNNYAEYQALLDGLAAGRKLGAEKLLVRMDSELVIKQMQGRYKVKSADLIPLHQRARAALEAFQSVRFEAVPREQNRLADELAVAGARM